MLKLNGEFFETDVVIHYMNDDVREELHNKHAPNITEQDFLDLYCVEHFKEYGEEFKIN